MKFIYIHVFTLLKKNTGDPGTYSATVARPPIQEQPSFVHRMRFLGSSQPPWILSKRSYASTLTHTPSRQPDQHCSLRQSRKRPSKSEAATSKYTDSGKHPKMRKQHFSTSVFLERGPGSKVRGNLPAYSTKDPPSCFLMHPI